MIDTPRISQMPDQLTAVIRMTGTQSEMQNETGNGYKELMAVFERDGDPAGRTVVHPPPAHGWRDL